MAVAAAAISTTALVAGVLLNALPAYAGVTSGYYTIGSPSGGATTVQATPSSVVAGASTSFEVSFTALTALSGSSYSYINVVPSEALASVPTSVDLVGGSCIQAGTSGAGGPGSDITSGIAIELGSSCGVAAGQEVEVFLIADAPVSAGSFYFTVTTSSVAQGTSNAIAVTSSASSLSAVYYGLGSNTTYSIGSIAVSDMSTDTTTLSLTAVLISGTGLLSFYNGTAGYTVSYTPSGGSATSDPVLGAVLNGTTVTLTLEYALANGETLNITVTGTNPPTAGSDDIDVQPGNGLPEPTSSITFGNSVAAPTLSESNTLAGAAATYTVNFRGSTAVTPGAYIILSELAGPTNFAAVSEVEVVDSTQGWQYLASGVIGGSGLIEVPVSEAINAGDSVTVTATNVVNPPSATITDFKVSTTTDSVAAAVAPYTIGAGGASPVTVTVTPNSTGAVATYTVTNLVASAAMSAGSSTIGLVAPTGTVFPSIASYYSIADSTNPSGSAVVTNIAGGGTSSIVLTVPANINSGDVLSVTVEDVVNPSLASSTYSLNVGGNVTGLTTTTTPTTTTTTTTTVPKPAVSVLTSKVTVANKKVTVQLSCGTLDCTGVVTLTDVRTVLGQAGYRIPAGRTGNVIVALDPQALKLLGGTKGHTITATETVTVSKGNTETGRLSIDIVVVTPVVSAHPLVAVTNGAVTLGISCSSANCTGTVTLVDVATELGHSKYSLAAGTTASVSVGLSHQALALLAGAKDHIINVTETLTVNGGATVTRRIGLVS